MGTAGFDSSIHVRNATSPTPNHRPLHTLAPMVIGDVSGVGNAFHVVIQHIPIFVTGQPSAKEIQSRNFGCGPGTVNGDPCLGGGKEPGYLSIFLRAIYADIQFVQGVQQAALFQGLHLFPHDGASEIG